MPRKKRTAKYIRKNLSLRADICAQIDEMLYDPVRGKPGHGDWSRLVERLLLSYLSSTDLKELSQ